MVALVAYLAGVQAVIRLMLALAAGAGAGPPAGSGAAAPTGVVSALLIDTALALLFALHHSAMARSGVKAWLVSRLPAPIERSSYVLVSSALLIAMARCWQPLPGELWDTRGTLLESVAWAGFAAGWALSVTAALYLNQLVLFGLRDGIGEMLGWAPRPARVACRGPYRWIRHPMYVGFVTAAWSTPHLSSAHALFAASMTLYALIGARLEERELVARFGAVYTTYRARTPAVLPRLPRPA